MGKYIVTARRNGGSWFVGGMTDWEPRDITVDYSFLPEGATFKATMMVDGINADKQAQDYAGAYETLRSAMTLPQSLGSGIWNRCKYVPYQFHMAQCLEQLGRTEEAREIYQMILDIEIEFFSKIHLRELPYYQALCAEALGQQPRAWDILARV